MKKVAFLLVVLFSLVSLSYGQELDVANYLQNISVTVKTPTGEGSGVLVTRELKESPDSQNKVKVNFIWTAAHVVDGLRSVREIVDPLTGSNKQVIEFKDAEIVKELNEDGRRVGEMKMDARIVKYSNADFGQDLALLMVRKRNYVDVSAKFYVEKEIVPVGTALFHVGSLRGQFGSNSMTTGIMSQVGRVIDVGNRAVFDQTSVSAFPGSSGGGVYTTDGRYIGMLVRGGGETFNFVVPIRRMLKWSKDVKVDWAIVESVEPPTLDELDKVPVEDSGAKFLKAAAEARPNPENLKFMFRWNDAD